MAVVRLRRQRSAASPQGLRPTTVAVLVLCTLLLPACSRVGTGGATAPLPAPTADRAAGSSDATSAEDTRTRGRPDVARPRPNTRTAEADVDDAAAEGEMEPVSDEVAAYLAWLDGPDEIQDAAYDDREFLEERVEFWMEFWQGRGRQYFERYLTRMAVYQPTIDRALMEQGLPPTLRYLPLIESGYNTTAVSRVGATGLWQFMRPTARWLGMRVDGFVDERRDPVRSTEEALGYLTSLHEDFNSWYLALAAYNAGPGRIGGILRRNAPNAERNDKLFLEMVEKFPRETTFYVPKLLAAAELSANPEKYGFDPVSVGDSMTFKTVEVQGTTSLDVVAEAAGAEVEDIVALNPHLVQRVTPLNTVWTVRVPVEGAVGFDERMAEIPLDERVTFIQHRVASGETLSHVAERYGIRLSQLRAANPGVRPQRMQIGQRLIIPKGPDSSSNRTVAAQVASNTSSAQSSAEPADAIRAVAVNDRDPESSSVHIVGSGDSPWSIAQRYGVSLDDLLGWNGLSRSSVLMPGDQLQIRGVAAVVASRASEYRVQSGDTLSQIAERHGVSMRALIRHNGLSARSVIKPGQRILIPAS